jgi:hypothetical protein
MRNQKKSITSASTTTASLKAILACGRSAQFYSRAMKLRTFVQRWRFGHEDIFSVVAVA